MKINPKDLEAAIQHHRNELTDASVLLVYDTDPIYMNGTANPLNYVVRRSAAYMAEGEVIVARGLTPVEHRPINVAPYATNVLDLVGRPGLFSASCCPIEIKRSGNGFLILVENYGPFVTDDNIEASRYLNSFQVGTFA